MKKLAGYITFVVLIGVVGCSENSLVSDPSPLGNASLDKSVVPPGNYQGTFELDQTLDLPTDGTNYKVSGKIDHTYTLLKGGMFEFSPDWSLFVESIDQKNGQSWKVENYSTISASPDTRFVEQAIPLDDMYTLRIVFRVGIYNSNIAEIHLVNGQQ